MARTAMPTSGVLEPWAYGIGRFRSVALTEWIRRKAHRFYRLPGSCRCLRRAASLSPTRFGGGAVYSRGGDRRDVEFTLEATNRGRSSPSVRSSLNIRQGHDLASAGLDCYLAASRRAVWSGGMITTLSAPRRHQRQTGSKYPSDQFRIFITPIIGLMCSAFPSSGPFGRLSKSRCRFRIRLARRQLGAFRHRGHESDVTVVRKRAGDVRFKKPNLRPRAARIGARLGARLGCSARSFF
jgi:hypothetical protein